MMHFGSIDHDTKAARVYQILTSRYGHWWDAWELTILAQTTGISTRISEIRQQLPVMRPDERIEADDDSHRKWFYRIVKVKPVGQLALGV